MLVLNPDSEISVELYKCSIRPFYYATSQTDHHMYMSPEIQAYVAMSNSTRGSIVWHIGNIGNPNFILDKRNCSISSIPQKFQKQNWFSNVINQVTLPESRANNNVI